MHLQRGAQARVSGDVRVKLRAVRASGARPGRSRRRERSTRDARAEALAEGAGGRAMLKSFKCFQPRGSFLCKKVKAHGPDDSPRQNSFPLLWVRIEIQQSSRRITMGGGAGVSGVRGSQSVDRLCREGGGSRPGCRQLNLGSHGIYEDAMGSCTSWCSLCEEGHCGLPQKTH